MAQEFKSGEIVPQSGIYRITHDPAHMEVHEVTALKGHRFPTSRHCKSLRFELEYARRATSTSSKTWAPAPRRPDFGPLFLQDDVEFDRRRHAVRQCAG